MSRFATGEGLLFLPFLPGRGWGKVLRCVRSTEARRWDKPPPLREEPKAFVRPRDSHARPTEAPHSATPGATSPLGRDVLTLLLKVVQASACPTAHPPPLRRDQETSRCLYKQHAGDQPRALRNRIQVPVAQASSLCVFAAHSPLQQQPRPRPAFLHFVSPSLRNFVSSSARMFGPHKGLWTIF